MILKYQTGKLSNWLSSQELSKQTELFMQLKSLFPQFLCHPHQLFQRLPERGSICRLFGGSRIELLLNVVLPHLVFDLGSVLLYLFSQPLHFNLIVGYYNLPLIDLLH